MRSDRSSTSTSTSSATPRTSAAPAGGDRNSFSARRQLPFRGSVATIVLGGALVLWTAAAHLDAATVLGMQPAFWAVCALLLGVELRPLFTAGARDPNGHLLTSAFVFAVLLRYGFEVAVLVQAVATTAIDLSRRKALWRTAFNVSQYALSWCAAAAAQRGPASGPPTLAVTFTGTSTRTRARPASEPSSDSAMASAGALAGSAFPSRSTRTPTTTLPSRRSRT